MKKVINKNTGKKIVNKKTRHISLIRLSALIIILTLILLGLYFVTKSSILAISNMSSSAIEKVKDMKQESVIQGLQKVETLNIEHREFSQKEVMDSLGKIINLPEEDLLKFIKITDSEGLAKQSPVFKGTKIGDYIAIYPSVAIVYDQVNNKLIKTIALK